MLVLKTIVNKKNLEVRTSFSFLDKESMEYYRKNLVFEILDTETNKCDACNLDKLLSKNIFGVEKYNDDILCFCINNYLLKLLDCINAPEIIHENVSIKFSHKYSKCEELNGELPLFYSAYNTDKGIALILDLAMNICIIDDNFILWKINKNIYYTILDIYSSIFRVGFIDETIDVYITSLCEEKSYKLDINKDVIKFMTKLKTLRK